MGAMPDADDDHGVLVLVDAKHDPVVASTGTAIAAHVASERLAEPLRIASQRPGDELNDRRGDFGRQTLHVSARGTRSLNVVRLALSCH